MSGQRNILYLLLLLALVRGIIYASVVPPWQAPDEPAQFERAKAAFKAADWISTAENGPEWYQKLGQALYTHDLWNFIDASRPTYEPEAPLSRYILLYNEGYQGWGQVYGSRLAYMLIGAPSLLASENLVHQLYFIRLNAVVMNMIIIFLAYLITRTIFPQDRFLFFGVPILILFNPQHTHLLSTTNNGNLAELFATAALYFMVQGVRKGFTWQNILAILGFSIVAMWTKATAFFLPFAIGTIFLFYAWQYRHKWYWLLPIGLILAALLYRFAPARLWLELSVAQAAYQRGDFYLDPIVPLDMFRSFWAMPGWAILRIQPHWYTLWGVACILAGVGLIFLIRAKWPHKSQFSTSTQTQIRALAILGMATLVSIGILLSWSTITNTIIYRQGRSIYPVIVPISLFLMLGWRQLIPIKWRDTGLLGLTTMLFLFDTMVLLDYIIPFFYSRY